MIKRIDDIGDDELRVIGHKAAQTPQDTGHSNKPWLWILLAAVLLMIAAVIALLYSRPGKVEETTTELQEAIYDPKPEEPDLGPIEPLGNYTADSTLGGYTEHLKMTINDIRLHVYIPHNAVPELMVGTPDIYDKSIVLTTQAADIRADNGKIVGAFVLKGEPLSWGLAKKGYCGIIDGQMTIGVTDLHQRTKEGLVTAKLNGKQIGREKGQGFETKKAQESKEIIARHSKDFGGHLTDPEVIKLTGLSRNTYYKYKRELLLEEAKNV